MSKVIIASNITEFKLIRVTCDSCQTIVMVNQNINFLPDRCPGCRAIYEEWIKEDIAMMIKAITHFQIFAEKKQLKTTVEFESYPSC